MHEHSLADGGGHVPVAVARRSGVDESVHFGSVVALADDGSTAWSVGDPDCAVYPRSALKPLQAEAMIGAGLTLEPELLAMVCASHDGTSRHLDLARRILAGCGLSEHELRNTPSYPLNLAAEHEMVRAGAERSSLSQNCSGKHAGMLATCVLNGWPTDEYLDPDHPLQEAITDHVAALTGEVLHVGVDGCGAPAHMVRLRGVAEAFATIARRRAEVWRAMSTFPDVVGGSGRPVSIVIGSISGVLAKDGAEGVFAAALPDGRAVAVKIADGAGRASAVVALAALERLGVDVAIAHATIDTSILGHGEPVGEVRAVVGGAVGGVVGDAVGGAS